MPGNKQSRHIPEDYDEYYLQIVRGCINYACPIAASLLVLFFVWDSLFVQSKAVAINALLLRVLIATAVLVFWFVSPKIRSLRVMMLALSGLYVLALITLIVILSMISRGLVVGIPGLMLTVMVANGIFCIKPIPGAISGLIGITALAVAAFKSPLTDSELTSGLIFLFCGVLVSAAFMILLDRELRRKHAMELSLEAEKDQGERLLKEILPRYVIQRIREGADNIAESVSEVNVIFIDIVGFTMMTRRLAPKHLVEILAEIFASFDEKCERHGVTKIKTIGDAYMAATGAPDPSSLSAVAAIEFCFDAVRSVDSIAHRTGIPIQVRLGVATGAAISGVLSLKRPAYDLWGETVNLASRMESTSEPGRVHIAETTYWRVKERYVCEPRGLVEVKGLGPIQTYFVSQASNQSPEPENLRTTSRAASGS